MKAFKTVLMLGSMVLVTVMGCGQHQGCTQDAGGNSDCPVTQYNPPDGDSRA